MRLRLVKLLTIVDFALFVLLRLALLECVQVVYGPAVHKGEVAVNVQVRQLVLGHLPLDRALILLDDAVCDATELSALENESAPYKDIGHHAILEKVDNLRTVENVVFRAESSRHVVGNDSVFDVLEMLSEWGFLFESCELFCTWRLVVLVVFAWPIDAAAVDVDVAAVDALVVSTVTAGNVAVAAVTIVAVIADAACDAADDDLVLVVVIANNI